MHWLHELNMFHSCQEYNVPLWSCPRFVFTIMGLVNIASILVTYYVGQNYAEPEIIIVIVTLLTMFILIITHVLVGAFERVIESRRSETLRTKEILELKDQFVYIAVHNIRSGATAIKWGLRTLESQLSELEEKDRAVFQLMRSRNERLLRLVRNVLLITKIESGKIETVFAAVALRGFMDTIAAGLTTNTRVQIFITGEDCSVTADPEYLEETLSLLIENACFHADGAAPQVHIAISNQRDHVNIAIENNGPGIPENERTSVFKKFWRTNSSGDIERTGFGLYVAHELVSLMGGTLTFESSLGKTVFTLSLPVAKVETN